MMRMRKYGYPGWLNVQIDVQAAVGSLADTVGQTALNEKPVWKQTHAGQGQLYAR